MALKFETIIWNTYRNFDLHILDRNNVEKLEKDPIKIYADTQH